MIMNFEERGRKMSKRFKHFMQTIAVTVLIFMLPQILCINCFAVGVGNTQSAEIMADAVDNVLEAEKTEAEILCEVEEMRTENTKYFMLSNGSYMAAQYTTPVHYEENGEWLEIDNTLRKKDDAQAKFVAEKTSTPATFPDKLNEDEDISIEIDGYKLKFKPVNTQAEGDKSNGKVDKAENLASNKIAKKNGKITAYDNSNKNEKLKRMDQAGIKDGRISKGEEIIDDKVSEEEKDMASVIAALKTIEVLGQILKNYPTDIGASDKLEIINEIRKLGMRSVEAIVKTIGLLEPDLVDYYYERKEKEDKVI